MADASSLDNIGVALREYDHRFDRFAAELAANSVKPEVRVALMKCLDALEEIEATADLKAVIGLLAIEVEDSFYRGIRSAWRAAPCHDAIVESARWEARCAWTHAIDARHVDTHSIHVNIRSSTSRASSDAIKVSQPTETQQRKKWSWKRWMKGEEGPR